MLRWLTGEASSSRPPPASGSLAINTQVLQVNDSLYELHRPLISPNVQIVFFHGLQKEDYSEAHLSTWLSRDGSCIWPKVWLAEDIPGVHVFSVRYSGDMYIIGENLLSDLLHGEIGQKSHCPVILVGHSIGGLVIKKLCQQAHDRLHISRGSEKARCEAFLSNLKGIFCYSTPHHGSQIAKKLGRRIPRPLFSYFETLSKDTARLNHEFEELCKVRDGWLIAGLSEGRATNLGTFGYFFAHIVVPEASARLGDFNVVSDADHFSICRPRDKLARSFHKLKEFVHNIASEAKDAKIKEEDLQQDMTALKNWPPENFQHVPKYVVGLDGPVQEIEGKLDHVKTLGLVGMGGLGKTTLAKELFNRLAPTFEYTCFLLNVKNIAGDHKTLMNAIGEEMHHHGQKVKKETRQVEWKRKPLLLVLDDISGQRDGKVLEEIEDTTAVESRIIFTSRENQGPLDYLGEVYNVDFLDNTSAKDLFLSCAFPKHKTLPQKLEGLVNAIIQRSGGLPLALEVLGKFLSSTQKYDIWKQTLDGMARAEVERDLNQILWANLRLSYDALDEELQQMFLDATTFFSAQKPTTRRWTLFEAKIAWRAAYNTMTESVSWQKLVDRSLVYDVKDDECIRVHEQLQTLGRKIARESINNSQRREWDGDQGLKVLHDTEELHKQEIFALRVGKAEEIFDLREGQRRRNTALPNECSNTALRSLKELRYLEVHVPILADGVQDCLSSQPKLVLLRCEDAKSSEFLLQSCAGTNLVLLSLSWENPSLPTCIGSFSKLRSLKLWYAVHLESLPDEIGSLPQLEVLVLNSCRNLQTLPESFGNLSALNHLELGSCEQLQTLPESFGNLSALNHLEFRLCEQLQTLPESFGNLSALNHLEFRSCEQLQTLPESFGNLSALNHLEVRSCMQLQTLPESFGNLSALNHLDLRLCKQLQLPESFGNLSALNHLQFWWCEQLQTLPESFGNLSALNHLQFWSCKQLQTLPESFGNLSALNHLEFRSCRQLQTLPESFGNLSALNHLEFRSCEQLQTLPESFGNLSALNHLEFRSCEQLQTLPESFGNLSALNHLEFRSCEQLQTLPESFGNLSALNHLEFKGCWQLQTLI